MTYPLVSVLIPAYRAERTLAATLDSVLAQTHPHVETVVVVDGSPDDTLGVARGYEARGVRVIDQPNAGASAARNRAFEASAGAFIQFLDADDLLAPDKIAVQLARLAAEPEGTIASGRWGHFDGYADPATATFQEHSSDWQDFEPATDWLVHSWQHRKLMFPGVWLIPRAVAERAGPWNEHLSLNDDGEYNTRLMPAAHKIAFCPDARAYYRTGRPTSLSVRKDPAAVRSLFLSYVLSETHLFAHDDSEAAHRAMARRWKELAFEFYLDPESRGMVRFALFRARQLGDFRIERRMGPRFNLAQKLVGWRAALRLQRAAQRLGVQRAGGGVSPPPVDP